MSDEKTKVPKPSEVKTPMLDTAPDGVLSATDRTRETIKIKLGGMFDVGMGGMFTAEFEITRDIPDGGLPALVQTIQDANAAVLSGLGQIIKDMSEAPAAPHMSKHQGLKELFYNPLARLAWQQIGEQPLTFPRPAAGQIAPLEELLGVPIAPQDDTEIDEEPAPVKVTPNGKRDVTEAVIKAVKAEPAPWVGLEDTALPKAPAVDPDTLEDEIDDEPVD